MSGSPPGLPLPDTALDNLLKKTEDPSELLAWLMCGDPLRLENRCAMAMRRLAFLVDPELLYERTVVVIAMLACLDPPSQENFEDWLEECIVIATDRMLKDDAKYVGGRTEVDLDDLRLEHYTFLLGLPYNRILPAMVAFNGLEEPYRKAFFALLIEDKPVQQCLDEGLGPPDLLRDRCMHALRVLLLEPLEQEGLL